MNQNELYHYGVKGMKWKNHKYQKLENGRYVYRTPAEQKLYDARKDFNKADEELNEAARRYNHGSTTLHFTVNNHNTKDERDAIRRENYISQKVGPKAAKRAYEKYHYEQALRKYKKSPMRNMKIAVRVGKARATNAIRHINERQDARKNKRQTNRKNRQFLRNRQYKKADLELGGGVSVTFSEPTIKRKKK